MHGYTMASESGPLQKWLTLGSRKYVSGSPFTKVIRKKFDQPLDDNEATTDFAAALPAADLVDAYPEASF
jgi:hypothetical protein